ncbi:hypothetical protein CIG75_16160 [Tumebacillus algifaecis]|uniref:LysM domain-containing protein n=1 Tax=Tumebacillus algifaecis TaxID=1214604 RepID=A0A223D3Z6_9BACL|nr:3D domain-containing protein [Tumebacillus algifaecis]ASS76329.1 hypothetical protein CIG75_16160 [Tumebacillus algifaecis]
MMNLNHAMLALVLSFFFVITQLSTPVQAGSDLQFLASTTDQEGVLYGPPIPSQIPTLASRSGSNLPKDVLTITPQTLAYTVQKGDSLYEIAKVFGTSPQALSQMNSIANPSLLTVGQELQVPNINNQQITTDYKIKQVLSADLTAYTAGPESTGKSPGHPAYGITASGKYVKDQHTIATDPAVIPLGTKVYIEGIGIRTSEDTGGAILGNRIDVYMNDLKEAIQFGVKRNIKVYILEDSDVSA